MGVADDSRFPDRWSETENVAWKSSIPGVGWSSPVVWGDRLYLTTVISNGPLEQPKKGLYFGGDRGKLTDEHRYMAIALDTRTGKVVWERELWRGVPAGSRHLKNSFASETPVTDGERVYFYFGQVGLFALDASGKTVWTLPSQTVETRYGWGTAASPVLHQGRIYVVNDNDSASYLMAVDAKTGKVIWKTARAEEKSNWSTPFIWEHDGKTEIITTGTVKNRSYDLDGKVVWEFGGMSSIVIPTPMAKNGFLYLASGYVGDENRPVFAIKPGARGVLTDAFIAWKLPQAGPYNPSPILYGDYYFTLLDRGFLTCHDARTGKEIYGKQRIDPAAAAFTSSPWASNGKLFLLSEDGDTFVVAAGPVFKVLGKNSLNEMAMATPAIARDSLYIRTASKVYKIAHAAGH
jgi:outer membrane protein assembly factor BamB